jgi:aspartyl-tRNA(Asn)/glutamyl-tRNA(Gln) amidotransferase subunit C
VLWTARGAKPNRLYSDFGWLLAFTGCDSAANASVEEHREDEVPHFMTAKVTVEDVERVAELARLELKPDEAPRMLRDLNNILDYVAELNQLDTSGVVPLAQVSELESEADSSVVRPDALGKSLGRTVVTSQAPETDGVFFKVPKVIER